VSEAEPAPETWPGRFGMIGDSAPMQAVYTLIEKVAPTDVPVLVLGETGTGKELVAQALHSSSRRAGGPFVAVNCAAVPAGLLEAELFGHKRGAFTGAVADREGQFAAAHKGTLLLDEVGDMPLEMQAKLLRALQEGEVRRVGDNKVRKVDVRVVAATHRDLLAMSAAGQFREDLYYRLGVVRIELPSLAERGADVAWIARALVARLGPEVGRPALRLDDDALAALQAAAWPGNVRQLSNELRRAVALQPPGDDVIGRAALSGQVHP
jgi:two-component system response regulator AtoC